MSETKPDEQKRSYTKLSFTSINKENSFYWLSITLMKMVLKTIWLLSRFINS